MSTSTVGVVGGGILGLAIARELTRRRPGVEVLVWEREDRVATHQTGHNSGVVHAGIYYRPGSLKAELCTRGRLLLRDYCAEHTLPYDECGKVVVAVDEGELARLDVLERTAHANGVPGLRRLDRAGLADVEPHAAGLAALHSPQTGITDYVAVARTLAQEVVAVGGAVHTGAEVVGVTKARGRISVEVRRPAGGGRGVPENQDVDELVLCGGLQSDRLGRLVGGPPLPRIVPFRGEYLRVVPDKQDLVRGMVYPVPDPAYPFLGVHFTRRVDGSLEVGPNAFLALSRDRYGRLSATRRDVADTLRFGGFWRFAGQHWRTGMGELRGVMSTTAYLRAAQRYVPAITRADVRRSHLGLRAQAMDDAGGLVDDFVIDRSDGITSVRNAPSPAATSSLAIAEYVVDRMGRPTG